MTVEECNFFIVLGNNHFLIWGAGCWDFHCARKFFFRTFLSQNIFYSWEGKQNIIFPIMWNRNTFFHNKFLAGDSIIFLSATMQNLHFFFSQLGYQNIFFLKIWAPTPDTKMVFALVLMNQLKVGMPLENIGWVGLIWNLVKPVLLYKCSNISSLNSNRYLLLYQKSIKAWTNFSQCAKMVETRSAILQIRLF